MRQRRPSATALQRPGWKGLAVASEAEWRSAAAQSRWVAVRLQIPYGSATPGSHPVAFEVQSLETQARVKEKSIFLVPR